uniref:Uncharacterized protein n=1 Tax=Romanomermis culicivorax TaxID=13658 RepID=A0A915J8U0_ROMCU
MKNWNTTGKKKVRKRKGKSLEKEGMRKKKAEKSLRKAGNQEVEKERGCIFNMTIVLPGMQMPPPTLIPRMCSVQGKEAMDAPEPSTAIGLPQRQASAGNLDYISPLKRDTEIEQLGPQQDNKLTPVNIFIIMLTKSIANFWMPLCFTSIFYGVIRNRICNSMKATARAESLKNQVVPCAITTQRKTKTYKNVFMKKETHMFQSCVGFLVKPGPPCWSHRSSIQRFLSWFNKFGNISSLLVK